MDSYNKCCKFFVIWMVIYICRGQDYCEDERTNSSTQYYNLADQTEASYTGTVSEKNKAVQEEYSTWCANPGTFRYRTFNGTCNHPRNLGAAFTPQDRLIPAAYSDGVNSPRQYGVYGQRLPSARNVSLHIHPPGDAYINRTLIFMAWGQWVDHDMVSTPVYTKRGTTLKCCGPAVKCPQSLYDPNCFPIELPSDDNIFPGNCLEFVRSLAATNYRGDQLVPRTQINSVTAFHDGSTIYGSTNEAAESLREPGGFLLRTKDDQFLPEANTSGCIKRPETGDYCFMAGDQRVNQHPYLGALHTIWLREHNRIARQLKLLRPELPNEEIFQRARRIVIARIQVITYNKWLPIFIGDDAAKWNLPSTYGRGVYNVGLDPRVVSSFSSAAFRVGHSTIPSYFPIGEKMVQLRYLFNRPAEVYYNLDNVLSGMTGLTKAYRQSIERVDPNFVDDISKFLFFNVSTGKGLDLISINIQRGRDLGLPPYVKWRSFCGLRPLTGFDDVEALGPSVHVLSKLYRSIEDIDLYTGLVHEPVDTGVAGPTARCILSIQFSRAKNGDRFFFDNDNKLTRFTDAQLSALRRTTLAEVICQNSFLKYITYDVFSFESTSNPLIPCAHLRDKGTNLELFA